MTWGGGLDASAHSSRKTKQPEDLERSKVTRQRSNRIALAQFEPKVANSNQLLLEEASDLRSNGVHAPKKNQQYNGIEN